jgi:hypothetical protein
MFCCDFGSANPYKWITDPYRALSVSTYFGYAIYTSVIDPQQFHADPDPPLLVMRILILSFLLEEFKFLLD